MKVLFVSFGIRPNRGAAAFVTETLANSFSPEEMVVVGEQVLFEGRLKRSKDLPRYYYIRTNLSYKGKGKRFTSFFRWLLFPWLLLRMQLILKREQCDYVLGTFPDNYYLLAAYLIAKWNGLRFSSYFHNTYLENRPRGIHHRFAAWMQPKVFDYSDYIFVMSEGMQRYYRQRYPDSLHPKFVPLIHTFEEYPPERPDDFDQPKERYDLILMGNFNQSNIEATRRLVEALKGNPRFRIKMITQVQKFLLRSRGIDVDAITYLGFVKQEDFYKEIQDNDFCILTHGFTGGYSQAEYETIFPTRTIPFLISGVPILAHTPPHAFLTHFLKKYDCAEVVDEASEEAIRQALERLIANPERRRELVRNARELSKQFYAPNVAAFLKEKIGSEL